MAKKKIRKISTLFLPALIFFIAGFFAFANLNYFSGIVGAVDNGGAFYIGSGSTFTLDSSKTISGFSSSSAGGGFYIASGGTMNITSGGVFKNSTTSSSGCGGGIYNAGTLNINGGIISENTSTSGGGIYSTGTVKMTDGTISGNNKSGSKSGDAVYLNGGTFTMSGGTISGNGGSTGQGNGCVCIDGNAVFTMSGGTIAQNKNMISCVYVSVGYFTLKGGTLDSIGGYGVFVNSGNIFTMEGGLVSSSSTAVYSMGPVVLKGGTVNGNIECTQMNFYSNANILGNIRLFSQNGTICMKDYDGTTPSLNIIISNSSRNVGPVVTFVGSSTAPDMSKIKISGYDTNNYRLKTVKDSSGNWTISLVENSYDFPSTWKTEVASSTYMTTTVTPANLTSIKFVATVPTGYTQVGTLSTGIPVYKGTTATDIAFVGKKIYAPESASQLFYNLSKLTTLDMSVFDTSNVTDMNYMFYNCKTLTSLDVSGFNTSNVTNMSLMFSSCSALTSLDVSGFNTSNVTNMDSMFSDCSAVTSLNVNGFNTSNVTNMLDMFWNCSALTSLNVSGFNTANVTKMYGMFAGCSAVTSLNVSNFDTSKVTDMGLMFYKCSALTSLDVSGFNTANVTDMSNMFYNCKTLTSLDVSRFYTSKVTNMSYMFYNCSALTSLDLSGFNTSKVTNMSYMFWNCSALTSLDVSGFNTANVTKMGSMFYKCSALTSLDVSGFNTSKVTSMGAMFNGCSALTSLDLSSFNMSKVTNSADMLKFGSSNKIKTFKTPYNNSVEIPIITGITLYKLSTSVEISSVPANTASSFDIVGCESHNYTISDTSYEPIDSTNHSMTTTRTCSNCGCKSITRKTMKHNLISGVCKMCGYGGFIEYIINKNQDGRNIDIFFEKDKQRKNFFVLKFVA